MTAYTDARAISGYLGATLTAEQANQAEAAALAATDWIDDYKGRSWQDDDGSVTAEIQPVSGDVVFLDRRPVLAVSSVETRSPTVGAAWSALASDRYELVDATSGVLRVAGGYCVGLEARVSYTHAATAAPAHIAYAATIIAASLLQPTLRPQTGGIDSLSVGQNDISLKFSVDYGDVPSEALTLLGARAVVIA